MSDWKHDYERQILFNHIAIMAGLKEFMLLSQGSMHSEGSVARFNAAIKNCTDLLHRKNTR